jgi:hypothetical protein
VGKTVCNVGDEEVDKEVEQDVKLLIVLPLDEVGTTRFCSKYD